MKKVTRMLATLAAMATMTVSVMPVCAEVVQIDGYNLDLNETTDTEQEYYQIDEYIEINDIDAACYYCGYGQNPQDRIEIEYINDKGRCDVEQFIKEQNFDMNHITIREMSKEEKFYVISDYMVQLFRIRNDINCSLAEYISENGEKGINIIYYGAHQEEKDRIESYVTKHEYDKIIPIRYTMIGSADDITDLKVIYTMLTEYIAKNNITANVYNFGEYLRVSIGYIDRNDTENEQDQKLITDFMVENQLDQSKVRIDWVKDASEDYVTDEKDTLGDANGDGTLNIRDCAKIAQFAAQGKADSLPDTADYNKDGKKNVRDGAAIAKELAKVK